MSRTLAKIVSLAILLFLGAASALSQSNNGQISGTVSDPQGLAVPRAKVEIVNQDTLAKRDTQADEAGHYSVSLLPAGRYQVMVEVEGFSAFVSKDITLPADESIVFNVQLTVGQVKESVGVQAGGDIGQIETTSAEVTGTISENEVKTYGLNGRVAYQLVSLIPGVSNQTGQDEGKTGVASSAKFSVNGGRVEYNIFEVDGSDVLNNAINAARGGNTFIVNPSVDAIGEMKVLTSNYGAMYGRTASGIVLISTKSGTSSFHGDGYEFIRNEAFNARNFFDQTKKAPLYRRNDFGYTLGGPVFIPHVFNTKKDKTLFFFSQEFLYSKTPVTYNQAVPSMAERSGDFSDVCPADKTVFLSSLSPQQIASLNLQNPGTQRVSKAQFPDCPVAGINTGTGDYFRSSFNGTTSGSVTDLFPIDPTAQAILATGLLPAPNSVGGCNSTVTTAANPACYDATVSPSTTWREELFRIDHNFTLTKIFSFRYVHDAWSSTVTTPQWGLVRNSFPTVENHINGPGLSMTASFSNVIGQSFTNHISFDYVVDHVDLTAVAGPGANLSRPAVLDAPCPVGSGGALNCTQMSSDVTPVNYPVGPIGTFFDTSFGGKIPALIFKGTNAAYGSQGFNIDTGYTPWKQAAPTYTIREDASKSLGKHALQFGVLVTIAQQNEVGAANGLNSGDVQGLLTFNTQGAGKSPITLASVNTCIGAGGLCSATADTSNVFANFLGGQIASYQQDSVQNKYYNRYKVAEPYIQDDWRITGRLTLNLGFRLGLFGSWYNPKGTAYNWEPQAYDASIASGVFLDPVFGFLDRPQSSSSNSLVAVPLNMTNPDPAIINGLVKCGANGVPNSCMTSHIVNPMPRVGFAWDIFGNGKTALRAGYGWFFEHGTSYEANTGSLIGSAPLTLSQTALNPASYQCLAAFGRLGTPCSGYLAADSSNPVITGPVSYPINVTSIPEKAVYPYVQQWSLSVEQQLANQLLVTVAYVGSKSTHLTDVRDLNQVRPIDPAFNPYPAGRPLIWSQDCLTSGGAFELGGPLNPNGGTIISPGQPGYVNMNIACYGTSTFGTPFNPSVFRPYPTLGSILGVSNTADSNYNAFQLTIRRSVPPLVLGISYTYSHSIDDSSDRSDADFVNSYDLASNKASSSFDQRHSLSISYVYDLPLQRGLPRLIHWERESPDPKDRSAQKAAPATASNPPSALSDRLLGGWQLSGITVVQTGTPFSVINGGSSGGIGVSDNGGVANYFGTGSYADCVGNPYSLPPVGGNNAQTIGPLLLNPGAFTAPRGLTFGDCGRNSLNNPRRTNFNVSLLKHFKVFNERGDLEFRAEAFNVFNHTQFRIYDPARPGNPGNNVIGCYGGASVNYSAAGGGGTDCLTGNSFLHPVDAHDPRIIQFGLKLAF